MGETIAETVSAWLEGEGFLDAAVDQVTPTTPLITSGILDSMAVMELLGFLEERYDVEFEAYELTPEFMDNLADIARLVQQKLDAR